MAPWWRKAQAPLATSVLGPPDGSGGGGKSSGRNWYSGTGAGPAAADGVATAFEVGAGRASAFAARAGALAGGEPTASGGGPTGSDFGIGRGMIFTERAGS